MDKSETLDIGHRTNTKPNKNTTHKTNKMSNNWNNLRTNVKGNNHFPFEKWIFRNSQPIHDENGRSQGKIVQVRMGGRNA